MAGSSRTDMATQYGAELSGTIPSQWGEDVNVTLDAKAMWNAANTAVTRYYTLSPYDFNYAASNTAWTHLASAPGPAQCAHDGSGLKYIYMPVHLPHGAEVTLFEVTKGFGDESCDGTFRLRRKARAGGIYQNMAEITGGYAQSVWIADSTTTISYQTVDNGGYNYFAYGWMSTNASLTQYIESVEIQYTITVPQP